VEADPDRWNGGAGKEERKTYVTRTNIYTSARDGAIPATAKTPNVAAAKAEAVS
jgi:hypothetical protein